MNDGQAQTVGLLRSCAMDSMALLCTHDTVKLRCQAGWMYLSRVVCQGWCVMMGVVMGVSGMVCQGGWYVRVGMSGVVRQGAWCVRGGVSGWLCQGGLSGVVC